MTFYEDLALETAGERQYLLASPVINRALGGAIGLGYVPCQNEAEADVLAITRGQPATVTLEALPGRKFAGSVVEIGASALPVTGAAAAREFRVVIRLQNPDPGLRPGLTGDAEITTSERTNVLTVPLQSVAVSYTHLTLPTSDLV